VHVECKSWNHDFALKIWGPNYDTKTAIGEIRQVRQKRDTGHPKFNIYFKDTNEVYTNFDLDYVLKYLVQWVMILLNSGSQPKEEK
jgi:hypothetical protein